MNYAPLRASVRHAAPGRTLREQAGVLGFSEWPGWTKGTQVPTKRAHTGLKPRGGHSRHQKGTLQQRAGSLV